MKSKVLAPLPMTILALSLVSSPGFAHHGTGDSYDAKKWATMTGVVTQYLWRNPHSSLYLDVKDSKGSIVHYSVEMNAPSVLERRGWTRSTIKVGDTVTLTLHPSNSGAPIGLCYNCKVEINGEPSPGQEPGAKQSGGDEN